MKNNELTLSLSILAILATAFTLQAADKPNVKQPGEGKGHVGLTNLPADAWTDCPSVYKEAQSVPLFQHRSMWGPASLLLPEYFNVTDKALKKLGEGGAPEVLLAKLVPLQERLIKTREEMVQELAKLLTPAEMDQFRDRILLAARGPKRSGARSDTNLIVPIGPIADPNNTIYDSDSYPRQPAKLVSEPILIRDGNASYRIEFEIDRTDDVEVRVVDAKANVVRYLGAGVIGLATAPVPFKGGTLKQSIEWDGNDDQGKPVPDGWRVEVGVGLKPRFAGFVGYDPAQLMTYVAGLQIDPKGRVYVWKHTPVREIPVMQRYDRDGRYLDMVYPSNPENLKPLGKKLEDVCERVEHVQGRALPIYERLLYREICRWDQFNNIPFVIAPDGKASFVELLQPCSHPPLFPENFAHVFPVADLDHFWLKPYHPYGMLGSWTILHNTAATTTDKHGNIYVATKRFEDHHGMIGMCDKNQIGTVIKIDPVTRQGINSFTWLGDRKLDQPRYFLGEPAMRLDPRSANPISEKHFEVFIDKKEVTPLAEDTNTSFVEIQSIDVDDAGNILVVDGLPRRIKMYASNGKWLGDVKGLTVDGRPRQFYDLAEVGHGKDAHYLITSFKEEPGKSYLIKCRNLITEPVVVWLVPLDEKSRYIAVDRNATPNLVWVGNGGGPGTFTRVEDLGDKPGEVRQIGGIRDGVFVDPWRVAASKTGKLFVYDHGTRSVVATDEEGKSWKSVETHPANPVSEYSERNRVFMHVDTEARGGDPSINSMVVDDDSKQLWINHRPASGNSIYVKEHKRWPFKPVPSPGVGLFDFDLNRKNVDFQKGAGGENFVAARNVQMPNPFAESFRKSNILYSAPFQNGRWNTSTQGRLVGRMIPRSGRDGQIMDWVRLALEVGSGSMTVDSLGNIYVCDLVAIPPSSKGDALFGFPNERSYHDGQNCTADSYFFQRGDRYVTHQSEIIDLVKFGVLGGARHTKDELWTHRGAGFIANVCGSCDSEVNALACDGADRILAADPIHYRVKVLDTAGHLIGMIGTYGNAETVPGADGNCDQLGFSKLFNISAAGDQLFAVDRDLHRIAKVKMDYRERQTARLETGRAVAEPAKTVAKVSRSPVMNNGVAEIEIDAPDQVTHGEWDWSGPADLSALARLEKTDKELLLTVDVTDNKLYTNGPAWAPSNGDSIEFYLDVRPPEASKRNAYEKGVIQIFIAPGLGKADDRIIISQKGKQIGQIPGEKSVSKKTEKGYQVILTIPFEGLVVDHYTPGDLLRFDVGVNDNDDGIGRTKQMMGLGDAGNWMSPIGFAAVNFGKN